MDLEQLRQFLLTGEGAPIVPTATPAAASPAPAVQQQQQQHQQHQQFQQLQPQVPQQQRPMQQFLPLQQQQQQRPPQQQQHMLAPQGRPQTILGRPPMNVGQQAAQASQAAQIAQLAQQQRLQQQQQQQRAAAPPGGMLLGAAPGYRPQATMQRPFVQTVRKPSAFSNIASVDVENLRLWAENAARTTTISHATFEKVLSHINTFMDHRNAADLARSIHHEVGERIFRGAQGPVGYFPVSVASSFASQPKQPAAGSSPTILQMPMPYQNQNVAKRPRPDSGPYMGSLAQIARGAQQNFQPRMSASPLLGSPLLPMTQYQQQAPAAPAPQPQPPPPAEPPAPQGRTNLEELQDVTQYAGINMAEESERSMPVIPISEALPEIDNGDPIQINLEHIQNTLKRKAKQAGLKQIEDEVYDLLGLAVQERLRDVLEDLVVISKHRVELNKLDQETVATNNVKRQLWLIEKTDREHSARYADETEAQRQERLARERTKARVVEPQYKTQMANSAALAATGMAQKSWMTSGNASNIGSGGSAADDAQTAESARAAQAEQQLKRNRAVVDSRRLTLKDLLYYIEHDRRLRKSKRIYKMYLQQR